MLKFMQERQMANWMGTSSGQETIIVIAAVRLVKVHTRLILSPLMGMLL